MRHVYRFTIAVSLLLLAIVSLTCSSKGHLVNSTVNRDGAAEDQTKSPLPFADGQLITSDGVVMHDQGAQTDHNLPGKSEGGVAKDSGSSVTNVCKTPPPTSYNPLSSYTPPKLQATIKVSTLSDSGPNSLREVLKNAPDAAVIGFDPGLA